jgi:hypothetical protein
METTEYGLTNVTTDYCNSEAETVHFHAANICILLAFAAPNTSYGQVCSNYLLFQLIL